GTALAVFGLFLIFWCLASAWYRQTVFVRSIEWPMVVVVVGFTALSVGRWVIVVIWAFATRGMGGGGPNGGTRTMNAWMRRGHLAGLLCLALTATGCSLGSLAYFLTPEQKLPPELRALSSPDHKQQVRVVVLAGTSDPVQGRGLIGVDRDLGERVA